MKFWRKKMWFWPKKKPTNVNEVTAQLRKNHDVMFVQDDLMAIYYPMEDRVLFFAGDYRGKNTEQLNEMLIENIIRYTAMKN